jgi:hypothetical protein
MRQQLSQPFQAQVVAHAFDVRARHVFERAVGGLLQF